MMTCGTVNHIGLTYFSLSAFEDFLKKGPCKHLAYLHFVLSELSESTS